MIVRSAEYLKGQDGGLNLELVKSCIVEHETKDFPRIKRLRDYYHNQPLILERQRPDYKANNRIAHGYPRYITLIASGYLLGEPVQYSAKKEVDLEPLTEAYKLSKVASVDAELARDASICGYGVELCYADEDANPKTAALEPEQAFVVYDDTVENNPLFGCHYYDKTDENGKSIGKIVNVYTDESHYTIEARSINSIPKGTVDEIEHEFEAVPVVEYWNNEDALGDFEQEITGIDAYNTLQSDRVNDKEQFVDSILVITGAMLQDTIDEKGNTVETGMSQLKRERLLNLPDNDASAQYLSNTMSDADTEILKNAIASDIHKFSMVPDLTDQNFAGNVSGVAMKYKLLGLELLTQVKEKWFREGLTERLKLFINFLRKKGAALPDAEEITMTFKRSLPANELEIAQMVATLNDMVSKKTLLGQVPFVEDVDTEIEQLDEQKKQDAIRQREAFEVPYVPFKEEATKNRNDETEEGNE